MCFCGRHYFIVTLLSTFEEQLNQGFKVCIPAGNSLYHPSPNMGLSGEHNDMSDPFQATSFTELASFY